MGPGLAAGNGSLRRPDPRRTLLAVTRRLATPILRALGSTAAVATKEPGLAQPDDDAVFQHLIGYIQESRGIDFRGYKQSSLRRRIGLRMQQVGADSFAAYRALLEADPAEFSELLNTVLINLTAMFRDLEAWSALNAAALPGLVDPARGHDQLRAWSVGCASGEEPYSIAMLLCELLGPAEFARRVKVYATDLDDAALNTARRAAYSSRDMENVPQAYLRKYFERTSDRYTVVRDLRKAVIFGRHNIVRDAPYHLEALRKAIDDAAAGVPAEEA